MSTQPNQLHIDLQMIPRPQEAHAIQDMPAQVIDINHAPSLRVEHAREVKKMKTTQPAGWVAANELRGVNEWAPATGIERMPEDLDSRTKNVLENLKAKGGRTRLHDSLLPIGGLAKPIQKNVAQQLADTNRRMAHTKNLLDRF